MSLAAPGLLNPTLDDVVRLAILALSVINVVVLFVAIRALQRNTQLLLDMEQFVREVRRAARGEGIPYRLTPLADRSDEE